MLIEFLFGEVSLSFENRYKKKVFSVLSRLDVPFSEPKNLDDSFSLYIPLYRKKAVFSALFAEGVEWKKGKLRGLPQIFCRYRKRIGIPIGLFLFCLIIWLSGRVIWCINIEGNHSVSDEEILEILEGLGCAVGKKYEDIDFDILHNRFLMECPDIAWIAVNMNGTHANVEIREVIDGEEKKDGGFYNIIAKEAGQIERLAATEGKPVVEIYDTVEPGELLISGAISYKSDTMNRFESAEGAVYARVFRNVEVNVPFLQTVKEYTGEKTSKKTVRFFNFDINLFRNSRISYKLCDKITVSKQIYLFDTLPLPLYIDETVYTEYKEKKKTLSKDEALSAAEEQYGKKLRRVLGDGELISRFSQTVTDEDGVTVKGYIYCIDDIGEKVPLVLTDEAENKDKETER